MKHIPLILALALPIAAQDIALVAQPVAPKNFILAAFTASAQSKTGTGGYGYRIGCKGVCAYTYNEATMRGTAYQPAFDVTTGVAVTLLHYGSDYTDKDHFHATAIGLGQIGLAQQYLADDKPKLSLDTITQFVRGGGLAVAVHFPKTPRGLTGVGRIQWAVDAPPKYTGGVGYSWGQ